MLVFPDGANKTFDGTTTATFTSLKGSPAGVTLVADSGNTATFDTADVGTGKTVTFSGYSLAGANASNFALPISCCAPIVGKTTANITPAPIIVVPPVVVVPPVAPPVVVVPPVAVVPPVELALVELAPEAPQLELASEAIPVRQNLNVTVVGTGVRMPPSLFAYTPPVPPAPIIVPPVVVPPEAPPPVYVPPLRPRKPDRG
jgi:hypothetical protein